MNERIYSKLEGHKRPGKAFIDEVHEFPVNSKIPAMTEQIISIQHSCDTPLIINDVYNEAQLYNSCIYKFSHPINVRCECKEGTYKVTYRFWSVKYLSIIGPLKIPITNKRSAPDP